MHCLLPIQERRCRHARPKIVVRLRRLRQGRWFPRSRLVRRWARLIMTSRSRMSVSSTMRGRGLDCEESAVVHFWLSIIILEVGSFLHHISRFTSGFIIGSTNVWQISLVTLSILPFIVAAGAIYTFVSTSIFIRVRKSYVQAGEIAQEVIGNVRTVQAFSAEERAVKVYLESMLTTYKYGRKAGLAKGLGIGTLHFVIYLSWALLVWFTSIIVHKNIANGADAFTTMLNVVFAGLSLGQAAPDITSFIQAKAALVKMCHLLPILGNNQVHEFGLKMRKMLNT